jgi:hypothetical protein
MRSSKICLSVIFVSLNSLPLYASTTMTESRSTALINGVQKQSHIEDASLLHSLREDVENHPNDFITFETQASAVQFIEGHWTEATRETEWRMVSRGIAGYWKDKMVVVLPTFAINRW